jgi:tellurite resistance protein TerC
MIRGGYTRSGPAALREAESMFGTPLHIWAIFAVAIATALVIDLEVFHRRARLISLRAALVESAAWIAFALLFCLWVHSWRGPQAGLEFLTGYLVEKSLSADNILVFLAIFQSFRVTERSQHKVLYYGVAGALVLRAVFVFSGLRLLQQFHIVLYVFGAILLLTGAMMLWRSKRVTDPGRNPVVRLVGKVIPVLGDFEGDFFFVKRDGRSYATTLFLALVAVEAMDILFAVDSVPAVLAITRDAFIVYSSNAFAILGLRALYFALAAVLPRLRFLRQGLAAILAFVGGKMLLGEHLRISVAGSLVVVALILAATITASLVWTGSKGRNSLTRSGSGPGIPTRN